LNCCPDRAPSKVRVIRTGRRCRQAPRERAGRDVIVREVPQQLPLVVVHDDVAVLEDGSAAPVICRRP